MLLLFALDYLPPTSGQHQPLPLESPAHVAQTQALRYRSAGGIPLASAGSRASLSSVPACLGHRGLPNTPSEPHERTSWQFARCGPVGGRGVVWLFCLRVSHLRAVQQFLHLLLELGAVVRVGDGDDLLGPLPLRLVHQAGDAVLGHHEVGTDAGHGHH